MLNVNNGLYRLGFIVMDIIVAVTKYNCV